MNQPKLVRRVVTVVAATAMALSLLVLAAPAALAQPANDHFANATIVTTVPFGATEDTTQATSDSTDPIGCSNNGSVWFAYTPSSNMTIVADTFGSEYDTVLSAWSDTQGALDLLACNDDFNGLQSRITFPAAAGTAVYLMVGFCCGNGSSGGGSLSFSINQLLPPINDGFEAAAPIAAVPFTDAVGLSAATTQPSEPPACLGLRNTAWYSFTSAASHSVTLRTNPPGTGVGVYTGTSLANLSQIACSSVGEPALLHAMAGTTYYIQVGAWCCGGFGTVTFQLDVAPDPVANFYFHPQDPSIFDAVQVQDASYDPAGGSISSWAWAFGDAATATGCCPTHQYTRDGDYTVVLTVTTADGRSASTSQVVQVRTRDVALVQIAVPHTAHLGQTISVNVHLRNNRYPETVRVDLFKSVPAGFTQVGSLTQSVPVRPPGGNSTRFAFSYTISQADKTIGKVTFRATATLLEHHDALPADNELTSPPLKIT